MTTPDLFTAVDGYIDALFAPEDPALAAAVARSRAAGLPEIQISAGQGKFLYLLARLTGARRILELGTLGGGAGDPGPRLRRRLPGGDRAERRARAAWRRRRADGFGRLVALRTAASAAKASASPWKT
jgi:predicted O-methyltransferase YrrM